MIVILAILAGIVVFAVGGADDRGAESACKRDKRSVETAIESHQAQTGQTPADLTVLTGRYLRDDGSVTATQKVGVGYTLTYSPDTGTLDDCAAALVAGGTPGGGGGGGGSTPTPTPTTTTPAATPLAITQLTPSSVARGNSVTVTISGSGFTGATAAISGLSTSGSTVVSDDTMTLNVSTTNGQTRQGYTLSVTDGAGQTATATFTVT